MLKLTIPGEELWDEKAEIFMYTEETVLEFEHSLVSLSKWEAEFHKLFLTKDEKTHDEMAGYVRAMLMTDVDPGILDRLSVEQVKRLDEYVNDPMTGTTFSNLPEEKNKSSERISSELIYFWMSQYQIGIEAERWHLNRLFTLIRVHHAKSQKPKKMGSQERARSMAELNAARKAKLGTSG